jgi:hypothetical protein
MHFLRFTSPSAVWAIVLPGYCRGMTQPERPATTNVSRVLVRGIAWYIVLMSLIVAIGWAAAVVFFWLIGGSSASD